MPALRWSPCEPPRPARHTARNGSTQPPAARRDLLHAQRVEEVAGAVLGPQRGTRQRRRRARRPRATAPRLPAGRRAPRLRTPRRARAPRAARRPGGSAPRRRRRPPRSTTAGCAARGSATSAAVMSSRLRVAHHEHEGRRREEQDPHRARARARRSRPRARASSYTQDAGSSAHTFATSTTAKPARRRPAATRRRAPSSGNSGKKRSPTFGARRRSRACAMSRYHAASQPSRPWRAWIGSGVAARRAQHVARQHERRAARCARDSTNGTTTARTRTSVASRRAAIGSAPAISRSPAGRAGNFAGRASRRAVVGRDARLARAAPARTASTASRTRSGA